MNTKNMVQDVQIGNPNQSISIEGFLEIVRSGAKIKYHPVGLSQIGAARDKVQEMLESDRVVYGVTTGFGANANIVIPADQSTALNNNLITSHAATYGSAMPMEEVKLMILMRLQGFGKGLSGIRPETIDRVIKLYNKGIIPKVEKLGSVGASGDLEPLSTLFGAYFHGVGELYNPSTQQYEKANEVLKEHGFGLYDLAAKEGLGFNNGPQQIMAYAATAIKRTENAMKIASAVFGLGITGFMAHKDAYDELVDYAYPIEGVQDFNAVMRYLLKPVEKDGELIQLQEWHTKPQSNYSWRAGAVTLGDSIHIISEAKKTVENVINTVTDNPLIYKDGAISSALFHGQVLGNRLDTISAQIEATNNLLAQATQRLLEGDRKLPGYLVEGSGINNGFMMTERNVAANAINTTSINYSSRNLPTGAQEDYVSMANSSAFQLDDFSRILEHQVVKLAITAVQSIHIRIKQKEVAAEKLNSIEKDQENLRSLTGVNELSKGTKDDVLKRLDEDKRFYENVQNFNIPVRLQGLYKALSEVFPYMEKDTPERPLKDEYRKMHDYLFNSDNLEKITALFDKGLSTSLRNRGGSFVENVNNPNITGQTALRF